MSLSVSGNLAEIPIFSLLNFCNFWVNLTLYIFEFFPVIWRQLWEINKKGSKTSLDKYWEIAERIWLG